jgi:predicted metalloprotease with PDZ domain
VAARLVDPVAGLPGAGIRMAQRSGLVTIASVLGDWALTLDRVPTGRIDRYRLDHAEVKWSAWNHEMSRSNGTWTSAITSVTRSVRT